MKVKIVKKDAPKVGRKVQDDEIHVGPIVSCSGHHFDANRFNETMNPSTFYGVTKEWNEEAYGPAREGRIQVKVVADGDYTVQRDNLSNYLEDRS